MAPGLIATMLPTVIEVRRPTPAFLNFNWSPRIMLSMTRNPAFPEQQLGALLQATCEIQYMNNVPTVAKSTVSDAT